MSIPDFSGTVAVAINLAVPKSFLMSNGTSSSWNCLSSSSFTDFLLSSVTDNDTLYSSSATVCVLCNSTGNYYFKDTIASRLPLTNNFIRMAYGNNKYVALDNSNNIYTSTDGIKYTLQSTSNFNTFLAVPNYTSPSNFIWDGSKFVICGQSLGGGKPFLYSTDGVTWTQSTYSSNARFHTLQYNGSLYLAGNEAGNFSKSTNGTTWSALSGIPAGVGSWTGTVSGVCYNGNTWLLIQGSNVHDTNYAYYSTDDGVTWNTTCAGDYYYGGDCTYNAQLNLYVISLYSGTYTSSDLTTWSSVTTIYTGSNNVETRLFSYNSYVIKCSGFNYIVNGGYTEYTTNGSTWVNVSDMLCSLCTSVPLTQWVNAPSTMSKYQIVAFQTLLTIKF